MSRKKQVYEKITALYCRISLDDGGDNESMSISNQKLMLRDFAEPERQSVGRPADVKIIVNPTT